MVSTLVVKSFLYSAIYGLALYGGVETDKLICMAGFVLPAVVSAIGGLVGAGMNAASQRAANERSFEQTKELFGMQQADRDEQNRWNSPAHLVSMLKSAGLSPASFYGGAAQTAGSAGVATPGNPQVGAVDFASPMSAVSGAIGNLTMLGVQKRNIQSETDKNLAQMSNEYAQTARSKFDLDMAKTLKETTIAQAQANLNKTIQDSATSKAQELLNGVEMEYRRVGMKYTENMMSLNDKQKEVYDKQIERFGFENMESISRIKLNAAETAVANETARQLCFSIEHLMPAMVADYAASAGLKTSQSWTQQENAKFQQWYNENMLDYLPDELKSKIDNMDANTKAVVQKNVRDWIKLPAEFLRDAGIGIGAVAGPVTQLLGKSPAKIGF